MEQTTQQNDTPVKIHELVPPARRPGVPRVATQEPPRQDGLFRMLGIVTFVVFAFVTIYFLLTGPLSTMTRASVSSTPSLTQSMIFAHPLSMKADGVEKSKVDIFIASDDGAPIPNKTVEIISTVGDLKPSTATTDDKGHAEFYLTMSEPGIASLSFTVDKAPFPQTITVKGE